MKQLIMLTVESEVDEAVQMVSEDRTGGRGGIGDMDERLAGAKERISM